MSYKFAQNIELSVPIECLIEDYQSLRKAKETGDWDEVEVVMECLAEVINRTKEYPNGVSFFPTENSLIAMSVDNGILCNPDGSDIKCVAGYCVSDAGNTQCDNCYWRSSHCNPEKGALQLTNEFVYDMCEGSAKDEELLRVLSENPL